MAQLRFNFVHMTMVQTAHDEGKLSTMNNGNVLLLQNWMICEDPACTNRTRRVPLQMKGSYPHCDMCKSAVMYREVSVNISCTLLYKISDQYTNLNYFLIFQYSEFELYTQLSFFQHIFNLSKVTEKRKYYSFYLILICR